MITRKNLLIIAICTVFCGNLLAQTPPPMPERLIPQKNVVYDFSFAELALEYFETNDPAYLQKIAELKATEHLFNHSKCFGYDVPNDSKIELVTYLLSSMDSQEKLERFKRNLDFAKKNIAETGITQQIVSQFLPEDFEFSSSLFFTYGYDLGVAYGKNASLNLAHPYFLENMNELKYYAIHELHHAGFLTLKNNTMPSLDITNYGEMAQLIEYLTHLEGMATYAPLEIRKHENAINVDDDYVALQDSVRMKEHEKEFFDIYFHFKNNPDSILTEEDWYKIYTLSDGKRLWYIVGANIAQTIDQKLGREKLTGLIPESSENFITTYLKIYK
ncbi:MAG: hypothetical protein LBH22_04605 [Bacteroidales bacterium]|jgi:hypothetical protein|nr:hypothetical protein [Bacteroidales bacterium]